MGEPTTRREVVRKGLAAEAERDASQHAVGGIAQYFFLFIFIHLNSSFFIKNFCVSTTSGLNTTRPTTFFFPKTPRGAPSALFFKALHGRLAGRFKPPLAGRCNDFAPSRQKNCHRQKQPSRPGPRKKKKTPPRPVPSKKKKKPPRPASEKKNNRPVPPRKKKNNRPVPPRKKKKPAPSRLEKKKTPPRPAMNSKIHRPEGGNWKQIPPPVSFSLFLVAHLYRIVV